MKKIFIFLVLSLAVVALSSCGLFKCKHKNIVDRVVTPTCTEDGYTEHTCEGCGEVTTDTVVSKLGHQYTEKVIAPTCTAEGYTERTCKGCGDSYKDVFTQKVAHPYKSIVVSPTCATEGYTEHTCTVCGDSYKDTAVAKLPHSYRSEVVSPTCSEEGYTNHICTVCEDSYKDTAVEKLPHTYGAEIVAPTCTAEGYTKHTCTVCGDSYNDTETAKTAHRFNGSPCKYCGMEEITENITSDTEWYSSEKTSFLISTPAQLAGLASLVNSGTTFSGKSVYLDADVDLGYAEWIPIGNEQNAFSGTFSGEGYTVTGLKINASAAYAGLFGNSKGKITNLNIANATVYSGDNYNYVSIACGYSGGEISDVTVSGYIDAKISSYVAGIVGFTSAVIKNCTNNAEIVADGYVGGIAGLSSNNISNCTNNGSIVGKASYVGGIVGNVSSSVAKTFENLENNGNITGTNKVAGIIGAIAQVTTEEGEHYKTTFKDPWYDEFYGYVTKMSGFLNTGKIIGKENVSGLLGIVYTESSYYKYINYYTGRYGIFIIEANYFTNKGEIVGETSVGEISGYFYSDYTSLLTTYTVTGKVTVNDEVKEGNCDVGSNTNLTLSGREVYVCEDEIPEETIPEE